MRKILVGLVFMLVYAGASAQMNSLFPKEPDAYLKELDNFMTAGKADKNMEAMSAFQKMRKEGKITDAILQDMVVPSNAMRARMMAPAPYFYNYLNTVMNLVTSGQGESNFGEWSKILGEVIKNQKKGDNNDFLKFLEFSNNFFQQNALHLTAGKVWKVDANSYRLLYEDSKPRVSFSTTNLMGATRVDTIFVHNTSGDYYPLEARWEGKSGTVDWARSGLDPSKVYATFNHYSINTTGFGYTVDTVTFHHKDYFNFPLTGRLIEKLVSGPADSLSITYPRFDSYGEAITIKDIAPNVSYTGGFSMNGGKVLGSGSAFEKPMLTFYATDGKTKVLSARAQSLSIKRGEQLSADKAEISIYFGTDSIYHPQLSLVYKIQKKEMRLLRGETGMGRAKFLDSYHNHEFLTDAIFWNIDSPILNLKILSGVGHKPGVYESVNYFSKEIIRKTQGLAFYEPLSVLKKLYETIGFREINVSDFAKALDPNLKEGESKTLLYQLVENGFIGYNEEQSTVVIKDKALNYVLANAKKIDYDIVRINSAPTRSNDYIDLRNSNIDLKGVYEVPISDTAFVFFHPRDSSISLQKDRNMEFDGVVYAGRTDMIGEKFKFQYAPFTVELTKVDTMRLYLPDSNKTDIQGRPILKPMKSKIEGIKGLLEIDAPINKSGRTRLLQFPKLYSRDKSFVYYDDPEIAKGAYGRQSFFFELEPFQIDSLNNFSPDILKWPGKLVSGGIFPDINDSLKLQSDGSLGFKSESPPEGFPLYGGKGKYYGKYELNYDGLKGSGRITHSTAEFKADDVRLYPDSLRATTDTFTIAKTFEGVQTPAVLGISDMIYWRPTNDSMHISMLNKDRPFAMYDDGFTTFKGDLLLTDKGLNGNGTLDWNEATLSSNQFVFKTMDLAADTASLNIKTTGDKVTFETPDVNAKVDFKTRIGDFVSNQKNIPTNFTYNQYTTAINEFKWLMDQKILDFKAPQDGPGEYFTSTNKDQKGLNFLGKRATYDLVSSILRVEQVPEIRVADASVIPDSGVVIIEEGARMHQLRNAVIVADTINKNHKFENCVVDIFSLTELKAIGDYTYFTKDLKQTINFGDISCKMDKEGKKRKQQEVYRLEARAIIDEKQGFVLYPGVKFNGEINILAVNPNTLLKGYSKIELKHPKATTNDFFIDQDVNRDTLGLKYDTATRNTNGNLLSVGIHLTPNPEAPAMYATLLSPKQDSKDITVFQSTGIVAEEAKGEYLFGDEKRIKEKALRGNLLRYNDANGEIKAEGSINLGVNLGVIKTIAAGTAETKLDSGIFRFNLSLGIDARLDDKTQEKMEFFMVGDNADQKDISYETDKQKKAISELADEKDDRKWIEEFTQTGAFAKRPKALSHNLVFSDVNFVFDKEDLSLRSVGKVGVAMVGKKAINKKLDGYIEFQYKEGGDVMTIYLQTGTKDWFFFEYKPGTLNILSSYDDVNKIITATAPDKRKIKGDNNRFYYYTLGSSLNKEDFVSYMKDKESGVVRARPEPRIEIPEPIQLPYDSLMPNDSTFVPDSLGTQIEITDPYKKNKARQRKEAVEPQPGDENALTEPPLEKGRKKKPKKGEEEPIENYQPPAYNPQEAQQELEKMKQQGDGFLSGPPKRFKPAPESQPVMEDSSTLQGNLMKGGVPNDQPAAVEEVKPAVPPADTVVVQPEPVKTDTIVPTQEVARQPVQPEPVKTDTVVVKPEVPTEPMKTDSVIHKEEVVPQPVQPEPVKTDSVPAKEELKPEPPKQEAVTPEMVAPAKDTVPIQPEVVTPPKTVDTLPVKEEVPPPAPVQEVPQPVQQQPAPDTVVPVKEVQPEVVPPVIDTPKTEPPKTEVPAVDTVPVKNDAPPPVVPAVEPPKTEAPKEPTPAQPEAPKPSEEAAPVPASETVPAPQEVKPEPVQPEPVKEEPVAPKEEPKATEGEQPVTPPAAEPPKSDSIAPVPEVMPGDTIPK